MSQPARATSMLLSLCALLLLALAAVWLAPGPAAQWRRWEAPAPQAPSLAEIDSALLVANPAAAATYPAVLERPLMDPARRPQTVASAPKEAASQPVASIEQVKLQGIVAGPALNGVLIEEDGKSRFVRRGERIGDWTLESLNGRAASFARGSEHRRIELPFAHGAATAPVATKAPAPQRPAVGAVPPPPPAAPPPAAAEAPPANSPARPAPAAPNARPRAAFGGSVAPSPPASAPR